MALALMFGAGPGAVSEVQAASSAASSASDSIATSVGSVSGSIQQSSTSMSKGLKLTEGRYRAVEVELVAAAATDGAQAPAPLWRVRLEPLQASAAQGEASAFDLLLPEAALRAAGLARGDAVDLRHRPYGHEFRMAGAAQPFFLVLKDDWLQELKPQPLSL